MTEHNNKTQSVVIKPRRMAFDTRAPMRKYTFGDNALISTFFYALSAMFPDGERFFIHSVRNFQKEIDDPVLQAQIKGFIGQEAHHGHSHEGLNQNIEAMGFPMSGLVTHMQKRVEFLKRSFGPARQLALTAAMEHFTAALAEYLLKYPEILDDADDTIRKMLIWHAVEEIEHKSVAFDVYRQKVNNEFMRKRVMVIAMASLFVRIGYYQFRLLKADGHFPSWKEWRGAFSFFWGRKGILRENMRSLRQYFRTGFHPSDINQQDLIDHWQERHPDVAALQTN
ncbi:MAG: metal-dependent hydrolase [Oceanospirillaceae bacterium]|uniref:metal-dependent hydrolase n=1 Tax=unclassified Thalassolituus TaxID=2624967 RepID=UPI000C43F436|nr:MULTISPECIES: metal-dependent hydrolase [unclassified Thalassolituus]MAS26027.1 metal-dependent hydrolase [Oceanospirillaceae bacterium]MBL33952.1 metal-dependent hydrolase [Oceanospirillaceae bacterium]MBS52932.1 metal-dependent hydrolase [Oceanospirillaceae bacterium]MBS54247.1 metal-dependent hydrolase [Oceanospirillaceae bacterium]|tara:strand:+ start:184 stop:1029 length:846 start_codon:yes stop_codon:yes gene_type:complete